MASHERALSYDHRIICPKDWSAPVRRMQEAEKFYGKTLVQMMEDYLLIECELSEDFEILKACMFFGRPPAF
jgi:hypothetical protein